MQLKKIVQRVVTTATALVTAASLAVTSFAVWTEHGTGNCSTGKIGSYALGYGYYNLSWRISLFVSTKDDGSIDPQTTNIKTQDGAALVGSIVVSQANLTGYIRYIQFAVSFLSNSSHETGFE